MKVTLSFAQIALSALFDDNPAPGGFSTVIAISLLSNIQPPAATVVTLYLTACPAVSVVVVKPNPTSPGITTSATNHAITSFAAS